MIKLQYFASLREKVGCAQESLEWCPQWQTIGDVRMTLTSRGGIWAEALAEDVLLMCAKNESLVTFNEPLADSDQIAFFPPVTGG